MRTIPMQWLLLCLLSLMPAGIVRAQLPAFPGAEGAGSFTSGGRGLPGTPTSVFEVTSLADDNTPGTLRWALNKPAAYRTVVFRCSGTIHLNAKLNVRANTTIAGQTAPGGGICLADYPVAISGDNVIVRYLRFRMGDRHQLKTDASGNPMDGSGGDDAFGNLGNKNLVIDHCSVSWSSDEALTVYRGDSVTLQWNFITEPLNYSYHYETGDTGFERHGFGGIWGSRHGSFHHNLFAHCQSRNPRFAGSSTYPAGVSETCDFANNVIYNWGLYTVYGGEGGRYNLVSNYYKYGPATGKATKYRIVNIDSSARLPYAQYYLSGNYVDGSPDATANNWLGVQMKSRRMADTVRSKAATPFALPPLQVQDAAAAYDLVLQDAGATLPQRDGLDQRIVNDVRNRTGAIIDVQGGFPHGTPYAQTTGAWPVLTNAAATPDTDHDGMPDYWEKLRGLDPGNPADRSGYSGSGYTNLEDYLNGITGYAVAIGAGNRPVQYRVSVDRTTAGERLVMMHPVSAAAASVLLYDSNGQQLSETAIAKQAAQTTVKTGKLAAGCYYLVYRNEWSAASIPFYRQ